MEQDIHGGGIVGFEKLEIDGAVNSTNEPRKHSVVLQILVQFVLFWSI